MLQEILNDIDLQLVVYIGAVVGGLLILEGIRQMVTGPSRRDEARSRRMKMIQKGQTTEEILAILKPEEKRTWASSIPLVGPSTNRNSKPLSGV